jgi:SAM-dependent methyltransferase
MEIAIESRSLTRWPGRLLQDGLQQPRGPAEGPTGVPPGCFAATPTASDENGGTTVKSIIRPAILGLAAAVALGGCGSWKRFAYEGLWRDRWQEPDRVVTALALPPGAHVADIGAGGGYFTFRLAQAVGPEGNVYAVDVDPDMTEYLTRRAAAEEVGNLDVVLAQPDDPGLAAASVDMLFTCNTYHHLDDPAAYFERARASLRPGGRVAIIDFNGEGWFSWFFAHATPAEQIRVDMERAGYELDTAPDFLGQQNFLIFRVAAAE